MEQHIRAKRVVDIQRDFAAVVGIGHGTVVLVVPQASRAKSVAELVALAKANPGKLTFASAGTGVINHLTGELFMQVTGVEMTHVPYKGTQQFLPDLLDGRVDMAFDSLPAYLPHLKSGRLRALAVAAPERAKALPEVPTMAEAGAPGVLSQTDYAIFAPAGAPREAIMRINRETNAVLQMDELRSRLAAQGIEVTGGSSEALQAELAEEITKWGRVIREAKIPPQ
jgi:tripartite-type tricarboxylate transporter receptor subunit TctC